MLPVKSEEHKTDHLMEERLAKVGAKIDELIVAAGVARDEVKVKMEDLKVKKEAKLKKGEEALDEFKSALDKTWEELNHAWKEIKEGTERAAHKLHSD